MGELVTISRAQVLERLAEIDALLDIMEDNSEDELLAERGELCWILDNR